MLKVVLLVVCIAIALGSVIYFFFWNRILGYAISVLLRLALWTRESSAVWVDFASAHFSLIGGRVILRDVRYHSSNQSFRIVKWQVSWRWWIRNVADEEDLVEGRLGSIAYSPDSKLVPRCRVHVSIEGLEWFMYNRTASFDNILQDLLATNHDLVGVRTKSRESTSNSANRTLLVRDERRPQSSLCEVGRRILLATKLPSFVNNLSSWVRHQLPHLNPKKLLPISFEVVKGAITMGNHTSESLLLGQFTKASGTISISQSRSSLDEHKHLQRVTFKDAAISCVENPDYWADNLNIGNSINECVMKLEPPTNARPVPLTYNGFRKIWNRCRKHFPFFKSRAGRYAKDSKRKSKGKKPREEVSHVGADFAKLEYAIDRKLLETPLLELLYYADVAGPVPSKLLPDIEAGVRSGLKTTKALEVMDIGNGDLPPEWAVEIVVHGGSIHYGPWADRQRVKLQRVFFPPTYRTYEPTPVLSQGDQRTSTCLKLFFEFRETTTLLIPFREASKNWQWDGLVDIPRMRKQREATSIQIRVGDKSTLTYLVPMVATSSGYTAELDISLDNISVTSSLNDIRLLQADSCSVSAFLPSPLTWNEHRNWDFDITLDRPTLYLIRDHINMLTDLGKDWASGPPHDFNTFVPIIYGLNLIFRDFQLNLYANDHNIIDRPLDKGENALFTLKGDTLKSRISLPSNKFRPLSTEVAFSIVSPDIDLVLTLPRWNTHALASSSIDSGINIGRIGLLRLDGSYCFHAEVRSEFVEKLKLNLEMLSPSLKLIGWIVRQFMVLRENYFGTFTQYSTTREYLSKREKGVAVGDPLDLKYRPGKSNVFHLDLSVIIKDAIAALPAGITGFEGPRRTRAEDRDVGSCVVLAIPQLQLMLRLHDFAMEISLNTDPVTLSIDESCPDRMLSSLAPKSLQRQLVVSGLCITANRLFGPQPHGTTYVCIWKILLGKVRGWLNTQETRILVATGKAFAHGFTDPFNAPSADYAIASVPDATILNISVDSLDVSWKDKSPIVRVLLEEGLRFAFDNIAGRYHRKTTSITIPAIELQLLVSLGLTKHWLEAGRLQTSVSLEINTAPTGWRKDAERQKEFLLAQDASTRRFAPLYGPADRYGSASWQSNLYLQKVRLPCLSSGPARRQTMRSTRLPIGNRLPLLGDSFESESDSDLRISEADRDKKLANSRPPVPDVSYDDGDVDYNSSPLDESDETDGHGSDDTWSDHFELGAEGLADAGIPYLAFCRKFHLRRFQSESDHQIDLSAIKEIPGIQSDLFAGNPLLDKPSDAPSLSPHESRTYIDESNVIGRKIYALDVGETRTFIASLCFPALKELLEQRELNELSPELQLDELMFARIATSASPSRSLYDVRLHSLNVCFVHEAPDLVKVGGESLSEDHHAFAVSKIHAQEIRLFLGLPPYDESIRSSPRRVLGKASARCIGGSLGTVYTSGRHSTRDNLPTSVALDLCVTSLDVVVSRSAYQVSYDFSDLRIFRSAPGVLIAAVRSLQAPVKELLEARRSLASAESVRKKHLLCTILSRNAAIVSKDLLSSVQPAFFVQSGRPQWLRGDNSWKLLFHLRYSLSTLSKDDYKSMKEQLQQRSADTEVEQLLQNRDIPWALEDVPSVHNVDVVESLFTGKTKKLPDPGSKNDDRAPSSTSFQANSLTFTIDGGDSPHNSFTLREIALRTDMLARRMVFEAVSLSPYSSTLRSFQSTTEYVDYGAITGLVSVDVESMQVTIFPNLIGFLQNAIHVWRILMAPTASPVTSASSESKFLSRLLSNRVAALDIRLVLNHILMEAAAENIVFEVTSKRSSSCFVVHVTNPRESATLDLSVNHTMGFQELGIKARTRSFTEKDMGTLAGVTVLGGISTLLFQNHTPHGSNLRGTVHAASLALSVPKSAIKLYKFMEQWRKDYLLGINSMLRSLFTEIKQKQAHPLQQSPSRKPLGIMVNASLSAVSVVLQVMHGTWLAWTAYDVIGHLTDRSRGKNLARTCGVQVVSQVIRLTSVAGSRSQRIPKIVLDLPPMSVSGSFSVERNAFLISVGFLEVTIKPSHWDSILSVQQKFGQDFNDLLLILDDARGKQSVAGDRKASTNVVTPLLVTARFEGFRLGLEGHSFTQILECVDIDAVIDNRESPHWQVTLTDFALYLSPRNLAKQKLAEVNRVQLPALISVDVRVLHRSSTLDRPRQLAIDVIKLHAILQAHLTGDIGDFVDHLQSELMLRRDQRAVELHGFKEKASKVMKAFNLNPRKSTPGKHDGFMMSSSINVTIANFGAVFPLDLERRQKPKAGSSKRIETKALLLSIKSIRFETDRGESGEAFMEGFCFQFVSRFDPSNPEDFYARRHHTLNQMLHPEMIARVRTETTQSAKRIVAEATINGFILDLDPSITSYIFCLVDAYRHGKRRVEQLAVSMPRAVTDAGSAAVQKANKVAKNKSLMMSIEASLQFKSGTVRMHCTSKDSSAFSSISPDWPLNTYQILDSDAEIFRLPALSVSVEYNADIRKLGTSLEQDVRCPVIVLRSTIHSSNNALRPLVLAFASGIVHNVEQRMKQSSHAVTRSPIGVRPSSSSFTQEERNTSIPPAMDGSTSSGLQLFVSLRIDKSRLEFTCRPDVNVIAGVNWESGGFVLNMGPGAKGVSISASIVGLTVGLKHGFLSDDSAHIDAKNLLFSINFSKPKLPSGQFINSISVVIDTEFSGGFRFSRFQDILCFKAVWLDHIPVFKGDGADNSISPTRLSTASSLEQSPKQGFDTAILIRVRRIALEADFGQSISTITFDLQTAHARTRLTSEYSEVAVSFALVDTQLRGNLSGHLRMPDFVFRTVRRRQMPRIDKQPLSRMLELNLTSGTLDIQLQSDWLWLLQYRAEPLEAQIFDDWTTDTQSDEITRRQLHLYSSISGSRVVAMMSITAIPKLMIYAGKLRSSLELQREGASRESSAFRSTRLPKPDNALSEVANAMFKSAKSKLRESESLSFVIDQHMKLQLSELVFVVLPRSQGDPELARFIGRNVMAELDRTVQQGNLLAHRNLHLSLSYMSISQLIKQGFDPRVPGKEFDVLTTGGQRFQGTENVIFSLPAMDMRMVSDEGTKAGTRVLPYDFISNFVGRGQRGEDIHISFNIRLYSWLTVLRKTLTRELKRAQEAANWKMVNISSPAQTEPKLPSPDLGASPLSSENDDLPPASPPSSRGSSQPGSPVRSRSVESVILSTPSKGKNPQRPVSLTSASFGQSDKNKGVSQDVGQETAQSPPGSGESAERSVGLDKKLQEIVYVPRLRKIERLTVKQLGEATPDVMHPFFTRKAGFNLEESLPQYVHEYAALPLEEIMKGLVKLYSKQLD